MFILFYFFYFIFFYFIDFQIVSSFSQIFALDEMIVKSILEFTKFQICSIDFSLVVENFKFPLIGQIVFAQFWPMLEVFLLMKWTDDQ